jgi:RES domain-containing protein
LIEAWRLARAANANLAGEGARLYGGRWNTPWHSMVYLAEHPALCVLEVRVHLDIPPELLPDDYVLMRVALPDEPPEAIADMPDDPEAVGDAWLASGRTAVLQVPSAIVPSAVNLLLNPRHSRATEAGIVDTIEFRFDPRLWPQRRAPLRWKDAGGAGVHPRRPSRLTPRVRHAASRRSARATMSGSRAITRR